MKVTTISTPIHDALGITNEAFAPIEVKAQRIAAIRYDSFVQDIDALTVALYASHPSACAKLLDLPSNDLRKLAAETAKGLHFNPCCIPIWPVLVTSTTNCVRCCSSPVKTLTMEASSCRCSSPCWSTRRSINWTST